MVHLIAKNSIAPQSYEHPISMLGTGGISPTARSRNLTLPRSHSCPPRYYLTAPQKHLHHLLRLLTTFPSPKTFLLAVYFFLDWCTISMILSTTEGSESCALPLARFPHQDERVTMWLPSNHTACKKVWHLQSMCRPTGPPRPPRSSA